MTKKLCYILLLCFVSNMAWAAGGGLAASTDALTTIKTWLYGFVGVGALVYMIWNVGMALAEKKQWSDVGMALGYCAIAGGCVAGGTWAYEIFL